MVNIFQNLYYCCVSKGLVVSKIIETKYQQTKKSSAQHSRIYHSCVTKIVFTSWNSACVWVVSITRLYNNSKKKCCSFEVTKTRKHNKWMTHISYLRPDASHFCRLVFISFALFNYFMCISPHPLFPFFFIPTGIRAANSCQTDKLIQSASRLSPRPSLILSINNPADSSLFFSNKEMDYMARLKANKLRLLPLALADSHWAPNEWMRRICHRCLR